MLFSMQIVAYLFLGGTAGGLLLIACLLSLAMQAPASNTRHRLAFDAFFKRCVVVGLVALGAAMLCLLWDLGRPERALNLFFTERPNVLTFGVFSLSIDALATIGLSALAYLGMQTPRAIRRAVEALCATASLAVILYTGAYLFSLDSVAFWHTPAIVALFLFSSLSCGASAALLTAWLTPDSAHLTGETRILKQAHMAFIALEAAAVAAFLGTTAASPNAARSLALLASDAIAPTAAIGVGGMALGVPFATEAVAAKFGKRSPLPACDALCLVGGFILRYCIVFCGTH